MKSKQYDELQGSLMDVADHPDALVPAVPNIYGGMAGTPGISSDAFPKGTPDLNKKKQVKQPQPGSMFDTGDSNG